MASKKQSVGNMRRYMWYLKMFESTSPCWHVSRPEGQNICQATPHRVNLSPSHISKNFICVKNGTHLKISKSNLLIFCNSIYIIYVLNKRSFLDSVRSLGAYLAKWTHTVVAHSLVISSSPEFCQQPFSSVDFPKLLQKLPPNYFSGTTEPGKRQQGVFLCDNCVHLN